ncbi:MAG: hypothetical protein N4A53_06560 [Pelagimonas sp.]|jgi:hypothetical protein|nr:hypothetical protein [Pelagimonas sp.]
MDTLVTFFNAHASLITQFILAVVGGGIISAYLTERWTRRRERNALFVDHLAQLIRSYHGYVRALNQPHSRRSAHELDQAHASLYAEAKLLGLSELLSTESEEFLQLADDMFKVRRNEAETKVEIEADLKPIFSRFGNTLDRVQEKLRRSGVF